jgi:arylsulfatase
VDGGWARAVPLAAPRTFPAADGERFRAVAFPTSGEATLELRTADGSSELRLARPQPLDFELAGPQATLAASPGVELLRPRVLAGKDKRGRRVLLAVADTLRFDYADEERMPELWSYFADGTRFLRAYSPASWTLPSLASVFTGQLPSQLRSPDGTLISLAPGAETIASELHRRGSVTVGVTANYTVNHENGFSTGFDLFFAPPPATGGEASGGLPDARWIAERAREAADWFAGEDLFLYLQFMEPHEPYRDHETGRALGVPMGDRNPDPATLAALRSAYASEARYLSRELGALLRHLGELDLAVFTADHGEEFFEHGGFRHGPTLYEEVVRVPLWIRGPGFPARTVAEPISLVALKRLLLRGPDGIPQGRTPNRVTMETFSYGPPRWSCILDHTQVIYFARRLVPENAEHPTARWLQENHPRMSFSDLDGWPIDPGGDLVRRSVDQLLEHFAGHRRGLFLLFEEGSEAALEVSGAGRDGLLWGDAEHLAVNEAGPAKLQVEVREPRPFALLFLPVPEGGEEERTAGTPDRGPRVVDLASGRPLAVAPIAAVSDPEARRPAGAVSVWLDPGRPPAVLRGAEETLERLKALGYI